MGRLLQHVASFMLASLSTTGIVSAAPFVYLGSNDGSDHVSVVDLATGKVVASIPVIGIDLVIGLTADQSQLYLSGDDPSSFQPTTLILDTRTNNIVALNSLGAPHEIATTAADSSRAYLLFGSIAVLDTTNGNIVHTINVPSPYLASFTDIQISPDGNRLYASDYGDGIVFVFNAHTYQLVSAIAGIFDPTTLAIAPDGSKLYVVSFLSAVYVINTTTLTVSGSVSFYNGGGVDDDQMVASPDGNFVYVADINNGRIAKIDVHALTLTNIPVAERPVGLSVSADGLRIYAKNQAGIVQVLSRDLDAVVETLVPTGNNFGGRNFVGEAPISIYVGNGSSNELSIIAPREGNLLVGPNLNTTAAGVVLSPDGITAYVSESDTNSVAFINLLTGNVFNTVPVGLSPGPIAVSSDGQRVYVANQTDKTVSIVDVATDSAATVALTSSIDIPTGIAVASDDSYVYVAAGRGITVLDARSPSNTPIYMDQYASVFGIAVAPDGSSLFVTLDEDNLLRQVDIATNAVIEELSVGPNGPMPIVYRPQAITLSPDGERAYVANSTANSLSIINNVLHELTAVVPVGTHPVALGVAPDDSRIYVANRDSDSVSVVDGAILQVIATLSGFSKPDAIGSAVAPSQNIFASGFE